MSALRTFGRFRRLSWRQRATAGEGLAALIAASAAIRLVPFARVVETTAGRQRDGRADRDAARLVADCRWAVNGWANRVPWRAMCFQRGLALHWMLRRRGVPSVLHYGVAQSADRGLTAHVWISAGGQVVLGGEQAAAHACLASFPAPR